MSKRLAIIALTIFLVPALVSAGPRVTDKAGNGAPHFVSGDLGYVDTGKALVDDSAADALRGILMSQFGANGDEGMEMIGSRTDDLGNVYTRFQQTLNGLNVYGAQMLLHYNGATGAVFAVTGDFATADNAVFSPAIDAADAFGGSARLRDLETSNAELAYVLVGGEAILAWMRTEDYRSAQGPHHDLVFVDATTGEELTRHPKVYYARSLVTYDCHNSTVYNACTDVVSSSSNTINTGDDAIDAAHNFAIGTYNYYSNNFGRDSLDDGGMTLYSNVHFDTNYNNAFWYNGEMTYGDGDGSTFVPLSQDADVVAHELTHGVTENTSNLVYANESGALNESMSDIFGALIDRQEGATGADIWKIGEDIYTPGTAGDALRYMADPTQDGYSSDYYPNRLYPGNCSPNNNNDQCGVHGNSGISNLAFQLLVDGGTHPQGETSNTVPALGFTVAGKIFYEANVNCLTSSSDFEAARDCTAAKALAFYGATEEAAVHEAWDAVGVPGGSDPPTGEDCPAGYTQYDSSISAGDSDQVTANFRHRGSFHGLLICSGADLDLYLDRMRNNGNFRNTVASSTSANCNEEINYSNNRNRWYRWRVSAYSGSASFTLCVDPG